MDDSKIRAMRDWAEGDFETFFEKMAKYMPTNARETRKQAREIYDMLKTEKDNAKILSCLEDALDGRERKGIGKGIAIGLGTATLLAGLLKILTKE